jgi:hypothetical protein
VLHQAHVGANHEARCGEQQGNGEGRADDTLHAFAGAERSGDDYAAKGSRHRSGAQPLHEPQVDGATPEMHHRAHWLHDGARDQVGRDRGQRQHIEEEHQDRRHQCTTAHPGEADDDADPERGGAERPVEVHDR